MSVMNEKLHGVWNSMKQRCRNPNTARYSDYGGRGITVCNAWNSYENFKEWALSSGYQDGLTIDRRDNDGNYEPSNCWWATRKEQGANKRNNKYVTLNGEKISLMELSDRTGIKIKTLYERMRKGQTPDEIAASISEKVSIVLDGEKITLKNLSLRTGIDYKTLHSRYKKGYTPEEIAAPFKQETSVIVNGESVTLSELSKRTGVKYTTLYARYKGGRELI